MNCIFTKKHNDSIICVAQKLHEPLPDQENLYIQEHEREYYTQLHGTRKCEFLSVRALLFLMLPNEAPCITYSETGKPYLKNMFISISHSARYVAIILNKKKNVAIDVEEDREKIIHIAPRFLNMHEQKNYTTLQEFTTVWSAKEVLYKLFEASPTFTDYTISGRIIGESGELNGKVCTQKIDKTVKIQYFRTKDFCVTWANN